ncbi:heparan-alpha-glucosaminide N-acetyltransferase domain-containing protein [Armatimonas sp.]|uniref:heparan-alpha-glucosaminide N-acetyltransferase domain-containing protein n=1 Tax=Armatimonas sp. TaxID=1872638 RepID=UPI00375117BD
MTRLPALDVARGIAVLGMIYLHLVGSQLANILEGRAAALFFLLAGMAWALQARHTPHPMKLARRALTLAVFGALFHRFVWPTEVLVPLALMMVLSILLWRAGQRTVWSVLVLILAVTPLVQAHLTHFVTTDWLDDGGHLADHGPGWATLRALVFDGNYPILPWLALPLLGVIAVAGAGPTTERARRCFWGALVVTVITQLPGERLGPTTWIPTTLPFLLRIGSSAATVIAGLLWWDGARGLPKITQLLARLGQASLTHYVLHLVAVFAPLRLFYPDEDWPVHLGLWAFFGYVLLALPLTTLWFRHFSRGPLESLWARA